MSNIKSIAAGFYLGIAAIAVMASSAQALPLPAVDVTPSPITGATVGTTATFGFSFVPNSNIDVVALGAFDLDGDGLVQAHDVGIWNAGMALLASTTVSAGMAGALIDNFRYVNIAPITLMSGVEYTIGGFYLSRGPDKIGDGLSTFTSLPDITVIQSRFVLNPAGLTFPGSTIGTQMYGAANFLIGIPEPATLALFGLGLAGLGIARRKRAA